MELDRKNTKKILLIAACSIALYLGLSNLPAVGTALLSGLGLAAPFLTGLFIAFVLNVPLRLFETRVFARLGRGGKPFWRKVKRPLCLTLSIAGVGALLCFILFLVIPELARAGSALARALPGAAAQAQRFLEERGVEIQAGLGEFAAVDWESIVTSALDFLKTGAAGFVSATVNITSSIFSGVVNFILGLIFSIYVLMQKEKLARQLKQLLFALLPRRGVEWIIGVGSLSNRIFTSFVNGQCVEAVIIGALCFAGMSVLRIPYAMTISVLVGFTALIPVFGAFIGTGVGAVLILTADPVKAVWFILFVVILQQVEGNLIYPHVVGSSVGLPGIWVMMAVTLGGGTLGVLGMLLSVPLCSVVYCIVRDNTFRRLRQRQIPPELWK